MKKLTLIPLTLITGVLAIGYASSNKKEAKADSEVTYIEMKADSFTDYTDAKGSFANADATFWGENYHFNALDTFFRGETAESWTGELTLKSWTQTTQYIYFTWGGAQNKETVYINVHYGEHVYKYENDCFTENPMMLHYFKIPDEDFVASETMYLELKDGATADYGFHNFGYLHVNQTKEQVSDAMRYYLNNMNRDGREWEVNKRKQILNLYYSKSYLKEVFCSPVSNIDEDFEDNEKFIKHWYLDYNYDNNLELDRHPDVALSNRTVRDGSNMPFNKTDARFFTGWFENGQGYVASDAPIYRFISRPFVLSGTGLISVKMAGRSASLHVIDTETQQDLVWADLLSYNGSGDEYKLYEGFNTVTMVRHYINLSAYLGRTIQLALADVYDNTWAASYFDELVTYYPSYPSFVIDVCAQGDTMTGYTYSYYFDKYINATVFNGETNPQGLKYVLESSVNQENENAIINTIDNSPIYEAHKFLENYYSSLRSLANEFSIEQASAENKKNVANQYRVLSTDAKAIVDQSSDLQYSSFDSEWFKKSPDTSKKVSVVMSSLVEQFATYVVSFSANGGTGDMDPVPDIKGEYELPECTFTAPEDKVFAGWKVNGSGDLLQPEEKINVSSDITLVAEWKDIPATTYTVSFNANGGSGDMEAVPGQFDTYVLPENGFIAPKWKYFIGWKVNNTGDLLQPGASIDLTADVTLYAQWEAPKYTVSFNSNGGSGEMSSVQVEAGNKLVLPACTFVAPEGKQFDCWIVKNEDYAPGEEVEIISNTEVFAKWKRIPVVVETYTVSFSANGGTGEMANVTDVSGDYVLPSCEFTAPEGKEFDGWLIGETKYQPGQTVSISSDTSIVASWKDVPVTPDPVDPTPVDPEPQPEPQPEPEPEEKPQPEKKGCGSSVIAASTLISTLALAGFGLLISKKRK